MRYALISDIHSNLEAFQAVLKALSQEKIDRYLCIGDVVGYGADPKACIELVKSISPDVMIAGNHDWGVVGLTDITYFNEAARAAIVWTKGMLGKDENDFLRSLPLTYGTNDMTLVHGTLEAPAEFQYILGVYDAYATMKIQQTTLCFVGHSHVAESYSSDGSMVEHTTKPIVEIDSSRKYVVNAGSVGQPRDGDRRASYVIYDDERKTIEMKRAEYDIEKAQGKILKAGLPLWLADRLSDGR